MIEKGVLEQWMLSLSWDSEVLEREREMGDVGTASGLDLSIFYLDPGIHTIHPQEYTSLSSGWLTGDDFLYF